MYRFSSPAEGCFSVFTAEYKHYSPARARRVVVDEASGHVIQLTETASGFPSEFVLAEREETIVWDNVKIDDETHLLAVAAEFLVHYSGGPVWRVSLEYKNHRHFEPASSVTYR